MKKLIFLLFFTSICFGQYRIKAPLYLYKSQVAPDTFTARILMDALTTARNFSLRNASGILLIDSDSSYLASKVFTAGVYTPMARTITISANAPLSSSAGAQSLQANRTWTLSIPNSANMVWEDSSNTFTQPQNFFQAPGRTGIQTQNHGNKMGFKFIQDSVDTEHQGFFGFYGGTFGLFDTAGTSTYFKYDIPNQVMTVTGELAVDVFGTDIINSKNGVADSIKIARDIVPSTSGIDLGRPYTRWDSLYVDNAKITNDASIGGTLYEDQPLIYKGRKMTLVSPYTTKTNVYKGQLHSHTTNSDGSQSPTGVVTFYKNHSYDFVSLTDHDTVSLDPGVSGILFIKGMEQEYGGLYRHICRINIVDSTQTKAYQKAQLTQDAIDTANSYSEFITLNHPYWSGVGKWFMSDLNKTDGYYAMDVWNALVTPDNNGETKIDSLLSKYRKLYLMSVDDLHDTSAAYAGTGAVYVYANSLSVSNIMESLKRGNFYASNGATITGISVSQRTITVTTGASSTISFIGFNGVVKQSTATATTASYTCFGDEVYIRAKVVRDSDSKIAWTNPIYLTQEPQEQTSKGAIVRGEIFVRDSARINNGGVFIGSDFISPLVSNWPFKGLQISTDSSFGNPGGFVIDTYGNTTTPVILGRGARGTFASPAAQFANGLLLTIGGRGFVNGAFTTGSRAFIQLVAAENWTSTAQGTYINFGVTANGATSGATKMRLDQDAALLINTTTNDGSSKLQVNGSALVNGKIKFGSNTTGTFSVSPMQMFADTTTQKALYYDAYLVRRTVDLSWNALLDSIVVSGTASETNLDTVIMGANYPAPAKYIVSQWGGHYNASAGGEKTFIFRVKKGTTLIDSVTVTTPAGGSTDEEVEITSTISFKSIGSSANIHSRMKVISENGAKLSSHTSSINTTTDNLFILSVQISTATAGNDFTLDQAWSTVKN